MGKVYVIAEIGQAHEGSLGLLYSYIDALAGIGVDAVKFQMHIAEAESSEHEPFRVKFSLEDDTRFDYWVRMGFTKEQWKGIKSKCEEAGLEFLCSPFSNLAVEWLEELGVSKYKIGSGEVNNLLLLEKIAKTGKPVILSSGMSNFSELDETTAFLKSRGVSYSVLQCTTSYPTDPKEFGLNVIQELKARYNVKVGFSDHSAKIETCIAAVALGAEIVEFHVVFDRRQFGPDSASSLTIDEVTSMIKGIRNIECAIQHPVNKTDNDRFLGLKNIFEKSLAVNKDLIEGHILTFEDLEAKKPKGYGIEASKFQNIIGKKITRNLKQWDFITDNDLVWQSEK
ncbi:N-acetylneuraminate synthase family protein [Flavobacterium amniphilum]|uniref:N-acetylneuraminate synthase family protein n=1 Tax=Flavobacterium amniphilum TaxID=1834035 RepID=UPI002029F47E|nr:N-acetylneuraminate synthase family protein [Flavobacterium amniphilum]MCL9805105.1 N-acetylneuraminate synthase family protein [Flavobacterium amniphilum]